MKHVVLFCCVVLLFAGTHGPKPFEGVIVYTVEVKPKVMVAGRANAWKGWGDTLKLYIKGTEWKEEYLSGKNTVKEVFYAPKEQKRYIRRAGVGGLEIEDVSREPSILQSTNPEATVSFVMGKQCKVFAYEADSPKELKDLRKINPAATGKVWFRYAYPENVDFTVEEGLAAGHKKNFLEAFYKGVKLPYYSYEYEDDEVVIAFTATAMIPKKLDANRFVVPK